MKFWTGGVAEWLNALVLKTSVLQGTGGSNPSPSAQDLSRILRNYNCGLEKNRLK